MQEQRWGRVVAIPSEQARFVTGVAFTVDGGQDAALISESVSAKRLNQQ